LTTGWGSHHSKDLEEKTRLIDKNRIRRLTANGHKKSTENQRQAIVDERSLAKNQSMNHRKKKYEKVKSPSRRKEKRKSESTFVNSAAKGQRQG